MSDFPQTPDWWQASDGKWYPPQPTPPPTVQPPPYGAAPYGYGYGVPVPGPRSTNGNAIAALVLGLVGLVSCGPLAGIPAIIFGSKAKKEIAASQGQQDGAGMATAGTVLGWISTVLTGLAILAIVALVALGDSNGMNSDPYDGWCNEDRYWQDPDC